MNPNQDRHRNLYEDPLAVLFWWYDLAIFALMFPSNSVIVFLRKNLGYRLMRPWVFWIVFAFLMFWAFTGAATTAAFGGYRSSGYNRQYRQYNPYQPQPGFTSPDGSTPDAAPEEPAQPSQAPSVALGAFAVCMGLLAYYHRKMGWELIFRNPDALHTVSRGDSHLQKILGTLRPISVPIPAAVQRLPLIKPRYHPLCVNMK